MSKTSHLDFSMVENAICGVINSFSLKAFLSMLMVFFSWVFQNNFEILGIVYLLILIDTITGVWYAIKAKEISSRGFYRVAIKCLVYFMMIIVSRLVDKTTPIIYASTLMDSFLVLTEAISILENISKLGFPVPTTLVKLLKTYYDKKQG
jgi:toxin secretion/phage lysis holin